MNAPLKAFAPLRQRNAEATAIIQGFLGLDTWEDDLIAPPDLIARARAFVEGRPPQVTPAGTAAVPRFTRAGDEIADHRTGLVWLDRTLNDGKAVTWAQANELAAKAGPSWRLPTCDELLTLVDRTRYEPAAAPEFSWLNTDRVYWSSTPSAADPRDSAWRVYFGHGSAGLYNQSYDGLVLAVRGGAAAPGQ